MSLFMAYNVIPDSALLGGSNTLEA
jgi:hypothetical protein